MPKVTAKNFSTGRFGGVVFRQELDRASGLYLGVAEVAEEQLGYFRDRPDAFIIEGDGQAPVVPPEGNREGQAAPQVPQETVAPKDPAKMVKADLQAELTALGVAFDEAATNALLGELLTQARAAAASKPQG